MSEPLGWAIFLIGIGQLGVLLASVQVPIQLKWSTDLAVLPRLHRQLYWVYGGYTALTITALGLVCLMRSTDLASGSPLAKAVCLYGAVFWGVRFSLQGVLDVKEYLTRPWLRIGYHTLTALFVTFTAVYVWAVLA